MTISTTTYKNTYSGDGVDTTFNFDFQILSESHLVVQIINSSGTLQTKTITVDYTVSGTGNTNGRTNYTSGTVTFLTAPLATDTVIIKRSTPLDQETDYIENGTFPADTHEEALDKLTLATQDMQEQLDRTFKRDYTGADTTDFTLPNPVANYYLRFNDAADGLEAVANTGTIGLDNIVEDPSPQLGGNLDINGNSIVSTINGNIIIEPNGTGEVRLNSDTVTIEDKLEHAGDSDTYINFTADAIDFQTGGSSIIDLNSSGLRIGATGSRITEIADEDNMISNSATALSTQQAIKAYVDTAALDADDPILEANLDTAGYDIVTTSGNLDIDINPHGSGDINLITDTGGNVNISSANNIDLQSDTVLVGQDIQHKGDTNNNITFGTDTQDYETGGSSRLDISNSGVRLGAANSRVTTILDEDTMSSNSATALSTQQSIKAYVDNKAATQAELEAASSTTQYTSPGRQQYHPSAAKFWALIDHGGGTYSLTDDYNVTSISDVGTIGGSKSEITVNYTTNFSSADYVVQLSSEEAVGTGGFIDVIHLKASDKVHLALTDGYEFSHVTGFGDQ